ncbi:EAL domain-containing protein [Cupriavidus oxalaticus]|uniref:EAL domain-containing protein n=1 Tax=Cupriavidus oxalaticus TaxID=96344 RepID=A0A4P7L9X5_9BURK|nr:EAL domain-containing protein [Cupriavidus oxalaticus]
MYPDADDPGGTPLGASGSPQAPSDADAPARPAGLLRWRSPVLGRVAPQDFLPALETLGLVERFGGWLLDSVLPLVRSSEAFAPLQFTLLASSAQLHRPQMVGALARAIDTGGIAAERLCIELPASAVPPVAGILDCFADLRRLPAGATFPGGLAGADARRYPAARPRAAVAGRLKRPSRAAPAAPAVVPAVVPIARFTNWHIPDINRADSGGKICLKPST